MQRQRRRDERHISSKSPRQSDHMVPWLRLRRPSSRSPTERGRVGRCQEIVRDHRPAIRLIWTHESRRESSRKQFFRYIVLPVSFGKSSFYIFVCAVRGSEFSINHIIARAPVTTARINGRNRAPSLLLSNFFSYNTVNVITTYCTTCTDAYPSSRLKPPSKKPTSKPQDQTACRAEC